MLWNLRGKCGHCIWSPLSRLVWFCGSLACTFPAVFCLKVVQSTLGLLTCRRVTEHPGGQPHLLVTWPANLEPLLTPLCSTARKSPAIPSLQLCPLPTPGSPCPVSPMWDPRPWYCPIGPSTLLPVSKTQLAHHHFPAVSFQSCSAQLPDLALSLHPYLPSYCTWAHLAVLLSTGSWTQPAYCIPLVALCPRLSPWPGLPSQTSFPISFLLTKELGSPPPPLLSPSTPYTCTEHFVFHP